MRKNIVNGIVYITLCVLMGFMYPKYCFPQETYRIIIEDENKNEIEVAHTDEDIYELLHAKKGEIIIKSKLLEYIERKMKNTSKK